MIEFFISLVIALVIIFFLCVLAVPVHNFIIGKLCSAKEHEPVVRYSGMCVIGYECAHCGYRWYEGRHKND